MNEGMDFGLDELKKNAEKLAEDFAKLDERFRERIAKEVLEEAGQIFLEEQKRLLSQAPNSDKIAKFANWLKVWIIETKTGWRVEVGYPTVVIRNHIEVMITEFGRPGAKGLKKGGKDSKGRKIGKVEPYSHIRASMFLKREAVMEEVRRRLEAELLRIWKG